MLRHSRLRAACAALLLVGISSLAGTQAYSAHAGTIRDETGGEIALRGINWFGFETETHVVNGLWKRNWKDMIAQLQTLGFNAVRLPLCPDTLHGATPGAIDYTLNPDLAGLDALALLDTLVGELDTKGFYILLDHHRPDCKAISPLWYTDSYSEQQWIADLQFIAQRYGHVAHVIGIDLKNEPHGTATWSRTSPATDWNGAAERAAHALLPLVPHWLIFVDGMGHIAPPPLHDPAFWGEYLAPEDCVPLDIPADRLVLSPHVYGPDVADQPYFDDPRFPHNMPRIWDRHFGALVRSGHTLVIGEFGGKYGYGDPRDIVWADRFVDYLIDRQLRNAFYWCLNPNSDGSGGILEDDWQTVRSDKIALLRRLWYGTSHAPPLTWWERVLEFMGLR